MEAATAETIENAPAKPEASPAEHRSTQELFRYSEWVHIGPGANECEDSETGECANTMHFHAWCRLPNQFQHKAIREKALAAKARRVRAFRDEDSDSSAILDSQLDEVEMKLGDEGARDTYIDELVYKDYLRDYFDAVAELTNAEGEDDEPGEWALIEEDRTRLEALDALPPEERPAEEYEELRTHVQAFTELAEERVKQRQVPVRESLAGRPTDELRRMVRSERVSKESNAAYIETYTLWEQYIGTMRTQVPKTLEAPQARIFNSIEHLKAAAPEVVEALEAVFQNLDGEFGKHLPQGVAGKG